MSVFHYSSDPSSTILLLFLGFEYEIELIEATISLVYNWILVATFWIGKILNYPGSL